MKYIANVYLFTNGMLAVFDDDGQQLQNLQGKYSEMKSTILDKANMHTHFHISKWKEWSHEITREEFNAL